jgi:ribosomal protein S18 acetylase RimI-like enzyme
VGFTFECLASRAELVRGEWVDDLRYSLLADDRRAWATRARSRPSRVDLVEITADDVALWGRLATHYSQQRFVATMQQSFRDALFPESVDGAPVVPWMRGVIADDQRAGFVMIARVTEHHPEPYLWRLLVDRWHQRRGIGEQVMAALVAMLGDEGHHTLLTSYVEGMPGSPTPFYRRLGFVPTGEVNHGETVARLTW